jgi:intracellular multiplication protein IcmB
MASKLQAVIMQVLTALKTNITDYCDLETIDDQYTIVANDGSLVSIVKFNGKSSVLGRNEYSDFIRSLSKEFSVFFDEKGHQVQFIFYKDIDSHDFLEEQSQLQRITAERLNLDLIDLINENVDVYSDYINMEECYIAFWSRPCLLNNIEHKLANTEKMELKKEIHWKATSHAQNILRPISFLTDRHNSFVNKIFNSLVSKQFGCSAEKLNVSIALREIKRKVFPDTTSSNWKPSIPFLDQGTGKVSAIPLRWKDNEDHDDMSEIMYPSLPEQIMVTGATIGKRGNDKSDTNSPINDNTIVKVGNRFFAPLIVKYPPSDTENLTFTKLFNDLNNSETRQNGERRSLPYSISFMIESDGMSIFQFKQLFTGILSITNSENKNINAARDALRSAKQDGSRIVKLRIAAMTWADSQNIKELLLRKQKLWKSIESWGSSTVYDRAGNPLEAFQSNVLALTPNHIGTAAPAPLEEALGLLPLTRPASPFKRMTSMMRSLDGKFLNFETFSQEQTTWLRLYAGRPGMGKSVAMNSSHIDSCLMPGIVSLPWMLLIDIGISSEGAIDAIRDALPPDKQHLAMYTRLQNTQEFCINICDIHLGGRSPLPHIKQAIISFITQLVTPIERAGKPYEGMTTIVTSMVELVYKRLDTGENGTPNLYSPGTQPIVDAAIKKYGIKAIADHTTYYDLVDKLFECGALFEAEVAQREAVPRLSDFATLLGDKNILERFGDYNTGANKLIDAFKFGLHAASEAYPMFNGSTKFDIGSSRLVALDLQDVVVKGKDPAQMHKTTLMYMIATQTFMKKIAFSKEDLRLIRPKYFKYYTKVVNELIDQYKILGVDEWHNTGGGENIVNLFLSYARENRKWLMEMVIGSQAPKDFGQLTEFASSIILLDSGTEETRTFIKESIGLTPVAESALITHCTGPSKNGATFLALIKTKTGDHFQLFTQTLGPKRLWRLTTTAQDRKLRVLLFEKMTKKKAIQILSEKFKSGSAVDQLQLITDTKKTSIIDFDDDEIENQAVEQLANQLMKEYQLTL